MRLYHGKILEGKGRRGKIKGKLGIFEVEIEMKEGLICVVQGFIHEGERDVYD